jgi:RHS repeat-associated protein
MYKAAHMIHLASGKSSRGQQSCFRLFAVTLAVFFVVIAVTLPVEVHAHTFARVPPMPVNGQCPTSGTCQSCQCQNCPTDSPADSATPPAVGPNSVFYRAGGSYEHATDLTVSAPGISWSVSRSYFNRPDGGSSPQGVNWLNSPADLYLYQSSGNIYLIVQMLSIRLFTLQTDGTYLAPADSYLQLTHDSTNSQYILLNLANNIRWTFYDFTVTNTMLRGVLKEQSTVHLYAQGKSGFVFSYNTNGTINQITSPTGQDYNIVFTYDASFYLTQIQIQDISGTALAQVNYTFYQNVTSPSTNIGSNGDLVQVTVSKRASNDAPGTMSIVRYTQYRYSAHNVTAVYENDAIQRIITSTGLSSPTAILSQANTYGTPPISNFASRSYTYYSANVDTSNINTPFQANENLNSEYGASTAEVVGIGDALKSETIGGCGGCGTTGSTTKNYFYLVTANSGSDQNEVTVLIVEDTQDSAGTAVYRTVYGVNGPYGSGGQILRKAFIQNPTTSPTYWCDSWTFAPSTGSTALPYRLAEHRYPSAHTGISSAAALRNFLNPYNGTTWSNDTATVNSSSGQIQSFSYNSNGMRTDSWVKYGESGTANYVWAADYGDSVNPTIATATYDYPIQTTSRSSGVQTSYSYTFYDAAHQQFKTKTTTFPVVPSTQNGSGVATTIGEYYDNVGRLRWTQDGEGYIKYYAYHPSMGTVAYEVVDIDPASLPSGVTSGSSGNWESVSTDGASSNQPTRGSSLPTPLLLTSATYYDSQGRITQRADPGGTNQFMVYSNWQTISFPYWNTTTSQCAMPIQITNLNSGAQLSDQVSVRANYTAISTSGGAPTGFSTAPSQSDYVTWTHYTYDSNSGYLVYTDRYITSPSSGAGTLSSDFYRNVSQYDTLGRMQYDIQIIRGSVSTNRVEQVTQSVYDVRDRVVQVNMGVSGDLAANSQNMTDSYNVYPTLYTISQTVYDNGGVGDGYATKRKHFFGSASTAYTGTNYYVTYRGHQRGLESFYVSGSTETAVGPYTVQDVDWKGRTITTSQYSVDPSWSTVLTGDGYSAYASTTSANRLTQSSSLYDGLNRLYQTQVFDIAPSSGTGSNYLARNTYYDRNNRQVASAPAYSAGTETAYDGAGRQYEARTVSALQSTLYVSAAFQYCAPTPKPTLASMAGGDNGVLTLSHRTLDANGNVLESDTFEDNHDDVTGTNPGINLTNNNDYVRRTVFNWYDAANRTTASADYGSGDSSSGPGQWKYATIPSRPSSAPTASANTVLVTLRAYYSDSGLPQTIADPLGTVMKYFYDNLGRKTYVAANWQSFVPPGSGTGNSSDRVTNYVYDGPQRVQQVVAMDPNGDGNLSDNQVTTYLYEDAVDANRNTSQIYPDSSDTTSSGTNQIKLQYNVDGSLNQRTDQRGTVLTYAYANNRLLATTSATTLGTGVDGTIQSIARTYDSLNRPQNITSYAGTGGSGTVVNDIQYSYYNDMRMVATTYQSHAGAVNTSTTLNVQYTYDTTATSSVYSNQLRLQTEVHPNARSIYYDYGSSSSTTAAYNALSNVREIWDGSPSGTGLALYDYSGAASRLALATYPQPSFKLDHFEGTSGTYAGLDRFGRTIDQYWIGFGGTSDVDRIHYLCDYAGNRLYRQIDPAIYPAETKDQAYTYDGLYRLLTSQIGTLSGNTIGGTPTSEEDWTLDGLGNWAGYLTKASGTTTLSQSRTANPANEISGISASVGSTWATPSYDLAGNMTTIPSPSNLTSAFTATYDAWNRLVALANGSVTVATFAYDGLNRRIVKGIYVSGTLDHNEHAYYNEKCQLLEVRKEVSGTINTNPLEQYVWHPFYIDAPVLRDYDAATSGAPVRYYYAFDANFNVTTATTAAGSAVERYGYSPYGTVTFMGPTFNVLGTQQTQIGNSVTFTGRLLDPESGLYYYRARYYNPMLGAFTARDPQNDSPSSLYEYVGSHPLVSVDPTGLEYIPLFTNSLSPHNRVSVFTLMDGGKLTQNNWEYDADEYTEWVPKLGFEATVFKACADPQLIPTIIHRDYSCNIILVGHHGGPKSKAALRSYPNGEPSNEDEMAISGIGFLEKGDATVHAIHDNMKTWGCKCGCSIQIFACWHGSVDLFQSIATDTGCEVYAADVVVFIGVKHTIIPDGRLGGWTLINGVEQRPELKLPHMRHFRPAGSAGQ